MGSVQVIGAGIAGFTLARTLVQAGYDGRITLSDPEGLPYDRPPLSKSLERVNLCDPAWFERHGVQLIQREVADIELPANEDDWLVLATGTTPKPLGIPGAGHAQVIHRAQDAQTLAEQLSAGAFGLQVVVIGAGLIGAEFASAARQFGAAVTLVSDRQVPGIELFGEPMARQLHADHRLGGVQVITGTVRELTATSVWVGDQRLEADIIVAAIGVEPNTALAQRLGLRIDQGILVDDRMRTSHPRVLAIGDAARRHGQRARRHWEPAMEDAAQAAATILRTAPPQRQVPWFWSDRHESHIEVVGDFTRATATVQRLNRQERIQASFGLDEHGKLVAGSIADGGPMAQVVRKLIAEGKTPPDSALQDPRLSARELASDENWS